MTQLPPPRRPSRVVDRGEAGELPQPPDGGRRSHHHRRWRSSSPPSHTTEHHLCSLGRGGLVQVPLLRWTWRGPAAWRRPEASASDLEGFWERRGRWPCAFTGGGGAPTRCGLTGAPISRHLAGASRRSGRGSVPCKEEETTPWDEGVEYQWVCIVGGGCGLAGAYMRPGRRSAPPS